MVAGTASRTPECLDGIRPSSEPRGRSAKDDTSEQREPKGEDEHNDGGAGAYGEKMRTAESESQQELCRANGYKNPSDAPANREDDTLEKRLRNDLPTVGADG